MDSEDEDNEDEEGTWGSGEKKTRTIILGWELVNGRMVYPDYRGEGERRRGKARKVWGDSGEAVCTDIFRMSTRYSR